jgi:hypothetical protein
MRNRRNSFEERDRQRRESRLRREDFRRSASNYAGSRDTSDYIRMNREIDDSQLLDEEDYDDDDFDSGYDDEEGYDDYEVRSSRVDFDHDYDETRGEIKRRRQNLRSDVNTFSDRGYAARGGYSGGSNYDNEYSGGSGYRGGYSSRYPENQDRDFDEIEKTWEHSSNAEDESRLDLYGGEPIGHSIRDRYTADIGYGEGGPRHGINARIKGYSQSTTATPQEEAEKKEKRKNTVESKRRRSLFRGVRTTRKKKSATGGGNS